MFKEEGKVIDDLWINSPKTILKEDGSIDSEKFREKNREMREDFERQKNEFRLILNKLHGDRRIIRLKDPKLIKIRTGLRILLIKEWGKRMSELEDQQSELHHKYYHDKLIDKATYDAKYQEIDAQQSALKRLRKASIVKCAGCGDKEKDHVYVPEVREWFYEECLEFHDEKRYFEIQNNWWDYFEKIYG